MSERYVEMFTPQFEKIHEQRQKNEEIFGEESDDEIWKIKTEAPCGRCGKMLRSDNHTWKKIEKAFAKEKIEVGNKKIILRRTEVKWNVMSKCTRCKETINMKTHTQSDCAWNMHKKQEKIYNKKKARKKKMVISCTRDRIEPYTKKKEEEKEKSQNTNMTRTSLFKVWEEWRSDSSHTSLVHYAI